MSGVRTRLAHARESHETRIMARERRLSTRFPAWRTRASRRKLALTMATGHVLLIGGAALVHLDTIWWYFTATVGGVVVLGVSWPLLRLLTGRLGGSAPTSLLDERERDLRYRATHVGFQVMGALMVLVLVYATLLEGAAGGADRIASMLAPLLLVGMSSPCMILGWTLQDDADDDRTAPTTTEMSAKRD